MRSVVVVDTNVPVVANGRDSPQADEECQLACVRAILDIRDRRSVALDEPSSSSTAAGGHKTILDEYKDNLAFRGEPGVGDSFFKHVFDHQGNERYVRRVAITAIDDDKRGFMELPSNSLDRSDRKFLAVATVAGAPIINAVDRDWDEQQGLLDQLSIKVEQLCPEIVARPRNRPEGPPEDGLP